MKSIQPHIHLIKKVPDSSVLKWTMQNHTLPQKTVLCWGKKTSLGVWKAALAFWQQFREMHCNDWSQSAPDVSGVMRTVCVPLDPKHRQSAKASGWLTNGGKARTGLPGFQDETVQTSTMAVTVPASQTRRANGPRAVCCDPQRHCSPLPLVLKRQLPLQSPKRFLGCLLFRG